MLSKGDIMWKERFNIILAFTLITLVISILSISSPVLSQGGSVQSNNITYSNLGNKPVTVYVAGGSFIGDPSFTLNELTIALENTPCGNCPSLEAYNNFIKAFSKVSLSNKKLLQSTRDYFSYLGDRGYCPHIPSTGINKMILRDDRGNIIYASQQPER